MTKENNKIFISFAMFFFLAFIISANAQSDSKAAGDFAATLQQKVLLNPSQANQVATILNNYFNNPSEENRKSADAKIESLLEEKQKMKYNIIKNDWWKSISREASEVKKKE